MRDGGPDTDVTIDWCVLQHPSSTTTTINTATELIYGRVYSAGCTESTAFCSDISAQLGYGDSSVDPSTSPGSYEWLDATYNSGHTSDNDDEWQVSIVPDTAGTYGYAYRFSGDDGTTWTYCDLAPGTNDGFSTSSMGALTVN